MATGGIGANLENPGRFFYDNAIMGIQLMEQARRTDVGKFVVIGTVCAYPKFTPCPSTRTSCGTAIARLTGFTGEIRWDPSKRDGQPRRALDTSRAREAFGFAAGTSFEDGLRATIEWHRSQVGAAK
jgi:nucleoside-diphosphate-sugar epimerase